MSRPSPVLEVSKLRVELTTRNRRVTVIDDVTFSVARGEILGIVGESGAGKSMTGMAVTGLLPSGIAVSGGEIRVNERRVDTLSGDDLRQLRGREVGTIFQDPMTSLNPLFTIGNQLVETICTHLDLRRDVAWHRAVQLLTEVGIPDPAARMHYYPHQFSGGMRQRVVIALALCARPSLIIADEPTTALDVSVQAQILGLLKRLSRDHDAAIVLITHDMGVIAELADRVAVLYAGRTAEIGPVRAVLDSPLHPYTAGLMTAIPQIGARRKRLTQIQGSMPRLGQVAAESCPFADRCHKTFDRCRAERPPIYARGDVEVACWLYEDHREGVAYGLP